MRPNRVKITRTNSLHQKIETTQTFVGRPQPLPLSTGSEIEKEDDAAKEAQKLFRGKLINPSIVKLMPTFLKAAPKLEASEVRVQPPQDEKCFKAVELISQPVRYFFVYVYIRI